MRRLVPLALVLLASPAAAQPPVRVPNVEPVLTVSVRLDAVWSAEPFRPLRQAVETDAPLFTAEIQDELGAKPLDFTRLTVVQFVEVPVGMYPRIIPVMVRTLARPVDEAALLKADGKVEVERGRFDGHPDLRLIRGRHGLLGVAGNQIVSIDSFPSQPEGRPLLARMFAEARKRDAEAAKDTAVIRATAGGCRT